MENVNVELEILLFVQAIQINAKMEYANVDLLMHAQ